MTIGWANGIGLGLDFFGLTSGPTYTVCICSDVPGDQGPPIPEPATGALLGLGLIALAAAARRRMQ